MVAAINTYILYSPLEKDRTARVEAMRQLFKQFTISESIYPTNTHIPFLKAIIEKSKERTNKALMAGFQLHDDLELHRHMALHQKHM